MEPDRPAIAWGSLALVAGVVLAIHATCLTQYGWFRDELYYLSCSHRLAWGYVDQPPLSIAVLTVIRWLAGPSLVAMRLAAVLFMVLAAANGREAARHLERPPEPIDVVVLDVGLPDVNGVDLCQHVREMYPAMPVVVCTGGAAPEEVAQLVRLGATRYFR